MNKWPTIHEHICFELICINLVSKEILFGLKKCSVSSLDLLFSSRSRQLFGAYDVNSEINDDILFKGCNQHSSLNQMGSEDCARRFKSAYLETLCLGETLDDLHYQKQENDTQMHFPRLAGELKSDMLSLKVSHAVMMLQMGFP